MSLWLAIALCYNSIVFLLGPISFTGFLTEFSDAGLKSALVFTVGQALVSALVSVILGLLAAPGYASLGDKFSFARRILRWIFLFPNMMSSVLAVLAVLLVIRQFPFGFWGVIIGHVFLNSGLCALWLGEAYLDVYARHKIVTTSLGTPAPLKFRKVTLPELWPQIRMCFAVTTVLCLTSFAVPLVLGGGPQSSTLEVLLFERIHAFADIPGAIAIAFIQCAVQLLVFLLLLKPIPLKTGHRHARTSHEDISLWVVVTIAVALVSLVPVTETVVTGLHSFAGFADLWQQESLRRATANSLIAALTVSLVTFFVLLIMVTWGYPRRAVALPTLSGVVVGLGLYLAFLPFGFRNQAAFLAALILGHLAVIFMPVFRLASPRLQTINARVRLPLESLGTSRALSLRRVYLPLSARIAGAGAVLAGCWSMGEFSVSSLVSHGPSTLPLFIQALLGSYRLELASACSTLLFTISLIAMTAMEILAYGLV